MDANQNKPEPDFPPETVRMIYLQVIDSAHGAFVKFFAKAVCAADPENFELLLPVAKTLIRKYKLPSSERIAKELPTITCPVCGKVSYNTNDIAQRYCGFCHKFHKHMITANGREWSDEKYFWKVGGKDCCITVERRVLYCDRGNFIAKLFPRGKLLLEVDDQDAWPRYYFDLDRAKLEIEAWLDKRGQ